MAELIVGWLGGEVLKVDVNGGVVIEKIYRECVFV